MASEHAASEPARVPSDINATLRPGCYLDWNYLHVTDPSSLVVENTLFLNTHAVMDGDSARHVRFSQNTYSCKPHESALL